jgi:hypothetical protein
VHFSALQLFPIDEMYTNDDIAYCALLGCWEFHSACVLNWLAGSMWAQGTQTEILTQRMLVIQDRGTKNYISKKTKKQSHF